jgi:uncharacterized membrane protein YgcG
VENANVFTLVSIDEIENQNQNRPPANREVEVKGLVVSSSATQLVVKGGGAVFTFAAAAGVTLPTIATGTPVEVRGVEQNGVITLERLEIEDEHESGSGHSDGDHGGGVDIGSGGHGREGGGSGHSGRH